LKGFTLESAERRGFDPGISRIVGLSMQRLCWNAALPGRNFRASHHVFSQGGANGAKEKRPESNSSA
jgi:hypothetical protein